jgi:hypothetical protein
VTHLVVRHAAHIVVAIVLLRMWMMIAPRLVSVSSLVFIVVLRTMATVVPYPSFSNATFHHPSTLSALQVCVRPSVFLFHPPPLQRHGLGRLHRLVLALFYRRWNEMHRVAHLSRRRWDNLPLLPVNASGHARQRHMLALNQLQVLNAILFLERAAVRESCFVS